MAWVDTGFRRTLKLRIHKTEENPSISGFPSTGVTYTIDGNTTQFTGETLTPYSWTNGLTMGQAPLAEFQARATATENWVKARFPIQATSGITWSNMRVGADAYIAFIKNPSNSEEFKMVLYDDNIGITITINTIETIRVKVRYTYASFELPGRVLSGILYFYINKGNSESTEYMTSDNVFNCSMGELISLYSKPATDVENIDYTATSPYSATPEGTVIDKQYSYTGVDFNDLDYGGGS